MKLVTKEIQKKVPALYSQDGKGKNAIVYCKFFLSGSSYTWLVTEMEVKENDILFFGFVISAMNYMKGEFGYFCLSELSQVKSNFGLSVERDLYFSPMTINEYMEKYH